MSHTNRNSGTHFFTLSAYNRFRRLTSPRSDSSISDAESVQSSQAEEQEVEDVKGKKTAEDPLKVVDRVHMKTDRKVELLTPLPPLNAEEKIFFSLSEYNRFLHRLMSPRRSDSSISDAESIQSSQAEEQGKSKLCTGSGSKETSAMKKGGQVHIAVQTFTFCEIAAATKNFRPECLLGEGGFGRVYKGCLESTGQVVAVKQLDRNRLQGIENFLWRSSCLVYYITPI